MTDKITMTREEKLQWMATWSAKNGLQLMLEGECGFGRECVGIQVDGHYPDYLWETKQYWEEGIGETVDQNVWTPPDAYHKHPCVAVLGRGEVAEDQLYQWLKWFDDNGFVVETGDQKINPSLGILGLVMGENRYARMVKK